MDKEIMGKQDKERVCRSMTGPLTCEADTCVLHSGVLLQLADAVLAMRL